MINNILTSIVYCIIFLFSLLPFRVLYVFSDVFYFVIYKVLKYRKNVVLSNLEYSFPKKNKKEIEKISSSFYKHLCDLLVETIKCFSISKKNINKRVKFIDSSLLYDTFDKNRDIIALMGHVGNWELIGLKSSLEKYHKTGIVYHKLTNVVFDGLFKKMRTRLGNVVFTQKEAFRYIYKNKNLISVFLADQNPVKNTAIWSNFLNQKTAFFRGPAIISKRLNLAIVYIKVTKPKRGYYNIENVLISDNPKNLSDQNITDLFSKHLENNIIEQPEIWLWSHKRWKHTRKYK